MISVSEQELSTGFRDLKQLSSELRVQYFYLLRPIHDAQMIRIAGMECAQRHWDVGRLCGTLVQWLAGSPRTRVLLAEPAGSHPPNLLPHVP